MALPILRRYSLNNFFHFPYDQLPMVLLQAERLFEADALERCDQRTSSNSLSILSIRSSEYRGSTLRVKNFPELLISSKSSIRTMAGYSLRRPSQNTQRRSLLSKLEPSEFTRIVWKKISSLDFV